MFAKSVHYALEELATSGYDVISLDWTMEPNQSRLDKLIAIRKMLHCTAVWKWREGYKLRW